MKKSPIISALVKGVVLVLALLNIAAALDEQHWLLELTAHFVMQYILAAVILLPFALYQRRWALTVILVLIVMINSLEVWRLKQEFSQPKETCDAAESITLLQANVYYRNWNIGQAGKALRDLAKDADIVILNEFDEAWREQEEEAFLRKFPHHYVTWIEADIEKMAIFSRQPFEVQQRAGRVSNHAHLRLLFPSYGLTLISYYGFAPINARMTSERNYELMRIAEYMKRLHSPAIVMGDFNQTPYATAMQNAMREGGLHFAPFPHGIAPSWPRLNAYTLPLEIPIDHLLANEHVRICKNKVIHIPGSDHGAVRTMLQPLKILPNFRTAQ